MIQTDLDNGRCTYCIFNDFLCGQINWPLRKVITFSVLSNQNLNFCIDSWKSSNVHLKPEHKYCYDIIYQNLCQVFA